MTHGGLVRQSWFTHPCVSFLSCILDGVAVLDLLEPPFSFTYIRGRQLQHPHSPAPRTLSFLLLPTTTPAWIHAPPPSPPPHNPLRRPVNSNVRGPLDVLYGFRGDVCVWSVLRRRGRQHEGAGRVREGKSPKPVFAWHCAALVGFASTTAVLERH